jgi:hypothetical protein
MECVCCWEPSTTLAPRCLHILCEQCQKDAAQTAKEKQEPEAVCPECKTSLLPPPRNARKRAIDTSQWEDEIARREDQIKRRRTMLETNKNELLAKLNDAEQRFTARIKKAFELERNVVTGIVRAEEQQIALYEVGLAGIFDAVHTWTKARKLDADSPFIKAREHTIDAMFRRLPPSPPLAVGISASGEPYEMSLSLPSCERIITGIQPVADIVCAAHRILEQSDGNLLIQVSNRRLFVSDDLLRKIHIYGVSSQRIQRQW